MAKAKQLMMLFFWGAVLQLRASPPKASVQAPPTKLGVAAT